MLIKAASSTILKVFGMTRPGIEPRSPGPLANTLSINWAIGLMGRLFANGPGNLGSILGRVRPKTQKMLLVVSLLKTQHYEVGIKGKVDQSEEKSCALPNTLV